MVDEMELVGRLKDAAPLRDAAFEEARARLRETMGPAHRQPRRRAWAIWSTAGLGIAATAAAVTLVVASSQPASPGGRRPTPRPRRMHRRRWPGWPPPSPRAAPRCPATRL